VAARIVEIGVFNTTSVAVAIKLVECTAVGTPGSGLVEAKDDRDQVAASSTAFDTHTVAPTLGSDLGYRVQLGASVGSGVIWTFDQGIRIPPGTGNGVAIIVATGTGQIVDWYIVWDE
jgi:hypothetical protein